MVRISLRFDTASTSQQKTCHCLGLSEIAQIMEADKKHLISNTVWSTIVGEPDAISTRTRQVPSFCHVDSSPLRSRSGYHANELVPNWIRSSPPPGFLSSESGEERGERAESLNGTYQRTASRFAAEGWRGAETERGIGSMRGCTGRDQVWCPVAKTGANQELSISLPTQRSN